MQKRSTDLKYDVVLENLITKSFVVKCDAIQGARLPKNDNLSSSYFKQQPSYFEASESRMKELQVRFFRSIGSEISVNPSCRMNVRLS